MGRSGEPRVSPGPRHLGPDGTSYEACVSWVPPSELFPGVSSRDGRPVWLRAGRERPRIRRRDLRR